MHNPCLKLTSGWTVPADTRLGALAVREMEIQPVEGGRSILHATSASSNCCINARTLCPSHTTLCQMCAWTTPVLHAQNKLGIIGVALA